MIHMTKDHVKPNKIIQLVRHFIIRALNNTENLPIMEEGIYNINNDTGLKTQTNDS